jgi:ribosomal protein S18 acetylase RimI-like enzyme
MGNCRILTPKDRNYIFDYLDLLIEGFEEIEHMYSPEEKREILKMYSHDFILSNLEPNSKKRFVGYFTDNNLDGILIEGFDRNGKNNEINRTLINWIMSQQKRQGIGTALITDCIERAIKEKRDVVSLGVSENNKDASRLYKKLGFETDKPYGENMLLMTYFINQNLKPR